jgi:hypothetical protein
MASRLAPAGKPTRNLRVPCWARALLETSAATRAQISVLMVFPPLRAMLAFLR